MIYTPYNAIRAHVFALDPIQRIDMVLKIDTVQGTIEQAQEPLRIGPDGNVLTVTRQFAAIWPIFGGSLGGPVLFHCHGETPGAPA